MPSLVQGYEYDVFISYRQKDNKYDGWVTEFVSNLRKELEATFKEDVTIYFDENPHDGLLETHDVDESLKEKLRCLIFIPIISQTYCDPKSFAWNKEFLAFKSTASADALGLKVKLANGNVASRILPVRIHELDDRDRDLLERELGPLRSVDFIFKSVGVNRPLRANEEHAQDNQQKAFYRDQMNKVANAVKEIVGGLQSPQNGTTGASVKNKNVSSTSAPMGNRSARWMSWAALSVLTLALCLYLYWYLARKVSQQKDPYDVAVMYLENFTDNEKYGDQLASLIHINLSQDTGLHLLPRQRLFDEMKEATGEARVPDRANASAIAERTGSRTMLTGSIHQQQEKALIQLELTEVATGRILKTEKLEGKMDQIFDLADAVCKRMSFHPVSVEYNVSAKTTGNYEAYQNFYIGLEKLYGFDFEGAAVSFKKSIELDSSFALGYLFLANSTNFFALVDRQMDLAVGQRYIEMARRYANKLSTGDRKMLEGFYQLNQGNIKEARQIAEEIYKENPNDRMVFLCYTFASFFNDKDDSSDELKKYLERNPSDGFQHNMMAYRDAWKGDFQAAKIHADRYVELEPKNPNTFDSGWEVCMISGQPSMAVSYLEKLEHLSDKKQPRRKGLHYLAMGMQPELLDVYRRSKDSILTTDFQEFLPYSLILEGKFSAALKEYDRILSPLEKKQAWFDFFSVQLHKGVTLMEGHHNEEALKVFDEVFIQSPKKLSQSYNPFVFLSCFYAGVADLRNGNLNGAEEKFNAFDSLVKSHPLDWRFNSYKNYLRAEIALTKGQYDEAKRWIDDISVFEKNTSMDYLVASYTVDWRKGDFKGALQRINPFYKNVGRTRLYQGGNPAHFACERAFAEYTIGRIQEDAGETQKAMESYKVFLDRFKNADPGITEKADAEKRMAKLSTLASH